MVENSIFFIFFYLFWTLLHRFRYHHFFHFILKCFFHFVREMVFVLYLFFFFQSSFFSCLSFLLSFYFYFNFLFFLGVGLTYFTVWNTTNTTRATRVIWQFCIFFFNILNLIINRKWLSHSFRNTFSFLFFRILFIAPRTHCLLFFSKGFL